jgi:hypothetical protein
VTTSQKIQAAARRVHLARACCNHVTYFDPNPSRLECCRELLSAERDLRRLTRPQPMASALFAMGAL